MFDSKVKLINKSIQISYDVDGFKYDIPIFIINDPSEFIVQKNIKEVIFDAKVITVF